MLHRRDGFAPRVGGLVRRLMPDQLFTGRRMLTVRQPCELLLGHLAIQTPSLGELPVPPADDLICLCVVVVPRAAEFRRVIVLRLPGAQWLGKSEHDDGRLSKEGLL